MSADIGTALLLAMGVGGAALFASKVDTDKKIKEASKQVSAHSHNFANLVHKNGYSEQDVLALQESHNHSIHPQMSNFQNLSNKVAAHNNAYKEVRYQPWDYRNEIIKTPAVKIPKDTGRRETIDHFRHYALTHLPVAYEYYTDEEYDPPFGPPGYLVRPGVNRPNAKTSAYMEKMGLEKPSEVTMVDLATAIAALNRKIDALDWERQVESSNLRPKIAHAHQHIYVDRNNDGSHNDSSVPLILSHVTENDEGVHTTAWYKGGYP